MIHVMFLSTRILTCLSLQDMMQCIAFATADQYHLPTLFHDLTSQGFWEIDLPRGTAHNYLVYYQFSKELNAILNHLHILISDAANVLVIRAEKAAKPEDDALIFFFR